MLPELKRPFLVKPSLVTFLVPLALCAALGIESGLLVIILPRTLSPVESLLGAGRTVDLLVMSALFVFSVLLSVYLIYRLRRPILTVDSAGITDNRDLSVGFLPWSEVGDVSIPVFPGFSPRLKIVPRDWDALLNRLPAWKRTIFQLTRRLGAGTITIPQAACSVPVTQVRDEIARRLNVARGVA